MKNIKTDKNAPLDLRSKSNQGGDTQGQVLRVYLKTYGCQMNVADSEMIGRVFAGEGFVRSEGLDGACVVVVNTCSVRENAENKAFSYIAGLRGWKGSKNGRKIVVAGCMAERIKSRIMARFPFVDLVLGAKSFSNAEAILREFVAKSFKQLKHIKINRKNEASEFVPIMTGCNNFCSYCIVPYVRGSETSFNAETIIENIKAKIESGITKIVLIGQNVNSYYGLLQNKKIDFVGLLGLAAKIKGLERLGFLTCHPKDMSRKLVDFTAACHVLDNNLHFALQSGSNKILKLMNRGYTREDYLNIVEYISKTAPAIHINTDIIVGFPGETEKDFSKTLDIIKKAKFKKIYAFKYSPREGTAAYSLKDDVPTAVKEERLERLLVLHKRLLKMETPLCK